MVLGEPLVVEVAACTDAACGAVEAPFTGKVYILALLMVIFLSVSVFVIVGCHRYHKFIDKAAPIDFQPVLDGLKAMSLSPTDLSAFLFLFFFFVLLLCAPTAVFPRARVALDDTRAGSSANTSQWLVYLTIRSDYGVAPPKARHAFGAATDACGAG